MNYVTTDMYNKIKISITNFFYLRLMCLILFVREERKYEGTEKGRSLCERRKPDRCWDDADPSSIWGVSKSAYTRKLAEYLTSMEYTSPSKKMVMCLEEPNENFFQDTIWPSKTEEQGTKFKPQSGASPMKCGWNLRMEADKESGTWMDPQENIPDKGNT